MALPDFTYDPPQEPWLTVLHEDADIIVLDKPSGLLSVPGRGREMRDSLAWRAQKDRRTATVVHRLDLDTSGIMVMALNMDAHRHISRQFENRETDKMYVALVEGSVTADEGEVNLPLIVDWPNRPKHMVCHETGKPSLTQYRVIGREEGTTRVALTPVTGRSHQLRVHMLALGHPIIGDPLYATEKGKAMAPRLCLHATELTITHPASGEVMTFRSEIPF